MQAAFSPIGAIVAAALMALRFFHEKMKEVNKEFRKMEEEGARPLTRRIEALREATVNAAAGMGELRDRLHEAATRQQTLKEKTEEAIVAMHQEFTAAQTLGEATMQNELARLDMMHAAGVQSEEEYATKKLEIRKSFGRRSASWRKTRRLRKSRCVSRRSRKRRQSNPN